MKNTRVEGCKRYRNIVFFLLVIAPIFINTPVFSQNRLSNLPVFTPHVDQSIKVDWLLDQGRFITTICRTKNNDDLVITNGLVSRTFRLSPYFACYSFKDLMT